MGTLGGVPRGILGAMTEKFVIAFFWVKIMKINFEEIKRLSDILAKVKTDRLTNFVAQGTIDRLCEMRAENLQMLFAEAIRYKVRYIYLGKQEIAGCERKIADDGWTPAMWCIGRNLGWINCGGNSDQYFVRHSVRVFPEYAYGGWDLKTETMLTYEQIKEKKFFLVVTILKEPV